MNPFPLRAPLFALVCWLSTSAILYAKNPEVHRIDPPHWWVGMASDTLELLIKGDGLEGAHYRVEGKGIRVLKAVQAQNPSYAYVTLLMDSEAPAQNISLVVSGSRGKTIVPYALKPRDASQRQNMGLSSADVLYLITPDRFANGNPSNDIRKDFRETSLRRKEVYDRHGGDLAGVAQRIEYIHSLGTTAVWLNPILENNQVHASYHGYAITDHYAIDPRYGTMAEYQNLCQLLHQRQMKVVMDVVYNHAGDKHYLFLNQPDTSWFNSYARFPQSNFRETTLFDPYASKKDQEVFTKGWFDTAMPDWNLKDPHAAAYLLQNTLWWIEEVGTDALRIDTYTYPDQVFMARLNKVVRQHYPRMFLFGETWVHNHQSQAYFVQRFPFRTFDSHLNNVTDFQTYFSIKEVVSKNNSWNEGVGKLYQSLAADYLYYDPTTLITFVDNHDEGRYFGLCGEDLRKYKVGLSLLYTLRGIPCLYYGTEILMKSTENHGTMRQDFPGGWPGDVRNAFESTGRTAQENEAFEFVQTLAHYRRGSAVLQTGKMMHFAPSQGFYSIARYTQDKIVLLLVNASDIPEKGKATRFDELLHGQRAGLDILHGLTPVVLESEFTLDPWEVRWIEFQR